MGLIFGKVSVETPKYELVAKAKGFEIREYVPSLAAQATYDPRELKNGRGGGFIILANYIGALGKPNNLKADGNGDGDGDGDGDGGEKIAMTAPVLMQQADGQGKPNKLKADGDGDGDGDGGEKIAMTAPVLMQQADGQGKSSPEGERVHMTAPVLTVEKAGDEGKTVTMQFILPSHYSMANVPRPTDPRVSLKELPRRRYGVLGFSGIASESLTEKKVQELRKALQDEGYTIRGEHILAQYNPPWTIPFLRTNEIFLPVDY